MKIFVLLSSMLLSFSCGSPDKNAKKDYLEIDFSGQVEKKYLDPDSRMQPVIILNDGLKYRIGNMSIYEIINEGDTLFKQKGSMKYNLIKKGDTILFYQYSGGKEIRDSGT